jgi:hypothetical protein
MPLSVPIDYIASFEESDCMSQAFTHGSPGVTPLRADQNVF